MTESTSAPGPGSTGNPPPAHTIRYVARSDRGLVRNTNQDSVFAGDRLLVVADGMGGHAAGDKASRLVVDAFAPLNAINPGQDLLAGLINATRAGNAAIAHMVEEHPDLDGMGTTLTAMLFDGDRAALTHVGDSRAYLYRSGVLHQLTHDDTFVQSLVDDGRITEHQAHVHPQRNLLLRALTGLDLDPSVAVREIQVGDRYLLCSDGLCGFVDAETIADALAHPDPEIAADTLIHTTLLAGAPDNVTVVVADVVGTGGDATDAASSAAPAAPPDPGATSPIQRLTRELPRIPLPPIPEEPGARATHIDDNTDEEDTADDDDEEDEDRPDGNADSDNHNDTGDSHNDDTGTSSYEDSKHPTQERIRRNRRLWRRRSLLVATIVVLLAIGITVSTVWVRSQYYVSDQGNVVVVFRGVNGSLLGWHFSTFEETSCAGETDCIPMKVSDLQPAAQYQVRAGIRATNLPDAREVVQRLSEQLLPPCPPSDAGEHPDTHANDEAQQTTQPTTPSAAPATSAPRTSATALAPAPAVPGVTCRTVS